MYFPTMQIWQRDLFSAYLAPHPARNQSTRTVWFPPCFVVLLALRQQGCVVRLAWRKSFSPPYTNFSPDEVLGINLITSIISPLVLTTSLWYNLSTKTDGGGSHARHNYWRRIQRLIAAACKRDIRPAWGKHPAERLPGRARPLERHTCRRA